MRVSNVRRATSADVFTAVADQTGEGRDEPNDDAARGDEPAITTGEIPSRGPRLNLHIIRVTTMVILYFTLLGLAVYLALHIQQQHKYAAAGQSALEAAESYATVLTSLDANHIDDNFRNALAGATGEFRDTYRQGSEQLRQLLIDNKASGTGTVVGAGIKSSTDTRVVVLLFVDQSITNAVNPSPRIDRNRIEMTMDLVDGHWLASRVEVL